MHMMKPLGGAAGAAVGAGAACVGAPGVLASECSWCCVGVAVGAAVGAALGAATTAGAGAAAAAVNASGGTAGRSWGQWPLMREALLQATRFLLWFPRWTVDPPRRGERERELEAVAGAVWNPPEDSEAEGATI